MCNLSDWVEEEGIKKGVKIGIEQGESKKLKEIIGKMFQKGMPVEMIADAIEESLEMVQSVIAELIEGKPSKI